MQVEGEEELLIRGMRLAVQPGAGEDSLVEKQAQAYLCINERSN
jgi:hypothetical protein